MTAPGTGLSDALAETRRSELVRAARALLRRPVLRAHGPDADDMLLVRRHAATLREWFDRNTGWRLIVESEVARLVKTVGEGSGLDDPTHPARDPRSGAPFTRRRYVLTCLALAVLERSEAQVTLGRLAEQVLLAVADPELAEAGISLTLDRREERSDLVAVVRLLLGLGVLARVAGDEDAFVRSDGDALYDVDRRVLSRILVAPRGPSTIDAAGFGQRLTELVAELPPTTDELRNRRIRWRLTRRLLEDPVLYYADLADDERAYLTGQRAAITNRIAELTGLVPEVRAEGIAMVDPFDDLTDVRMPESGTEGHVTLLLAEYLGAAGQPVEIATLQARVRDWAAEHGSYWRKDARAPGAEADLTEQALRRLVALRLVRRDGGLIHPLPALHRYAVAAPTIQASPR